MGHSGYIQIELAPEERVKICEHPDLAPPTHSEKRAKVRFARKGNMTTLKKQFAVDDPHFLSEVLNASRRSINTTRPEVAKITGLSRTLVTKYIDIGLEMGLLQEGELGNSKGGRAPRLLEFRKNAGFLLIAELGATGMSLARTDLSGNIETFLKIDIDISQELDAIFELVEKTFDEMRCDGAGNLWGIGIGLPGPVEFASGIPVSPPIMPGWHRYPVRQRLSEKYQAPVWIDNDVNLMALGEATINPDQKHQEFIYVKIGNGIGAAIISHGKLHRGAQGSAGDIGHIAVTEPTEIVCRCGNFGCLEAIAGGGALARDAALAIESGNSDFLAGLLRKNGTITARDVIEGAKHADAWSIQAINKTGRQVGNVLAALINFYNPPLIIIGGGVAKAGNPLLAAIRETVYRRSLPLATSNLEIRLGESGNQTGLHGAAEMILSELFAPEILSQWAESGSPTLPIVYEK